jgi:ssDNA-binding Zn-finger/Zn-ribbon topoisomerase 1
MDPTNNSKTKGIMVTLPKNLAERLAFLRNFHHRKINLNPRISKAMFELVGDIEKELKIEHDTWANAKKCPKCNSGIIFVKKTAKSKFYGCSKYPLCKHSENVKAHSKGEVNEK